MSASAHLNPETARPSPPPEIENDLRAVAAGDIDAAPGRRLVMSLAGHPAPSWQGRVRDALSKWTWRALTDRLRDATVLAEWCSVLDAAAAQLRETDPDGAGALAGCHELVRHSLLVAEMIDTDRERLLNRLHVPEILTLLGARHDATPRGEILHRLRQMTPQNLSRVTALMIEGGLVESRSRGRETYLELTREGVAAARMIGTSEPMPPAVPEVRQEVLSPGAVMGSYQLRSAMPVNKAA